MNKNILTTTTLLFINTLIIGQNLLINNRYRQVNFSVNVLEDVIYATNTMGVGGLNPSEADIDPTDLVMDIYVPQNDSLDLKPVVLCFHGGGFVAGSFQNDDMLAFCDSLSKKGYLTATVQYRLGVNLLDSKSSQRALYRAVQDSRSAIRFIKANANTYGIDTNQIYLLGSSAGALTCLHNGFLDTPQEAPDAIQPYTYAFQTVPYLGPLDTGLYLGHDGQADAIFSLWGSILDTHYIKQGNEMPIHLVHGIDDNTVPFLTDGAFFGLAPFPDSHGSGIISQRFNSIGKSHSTYFVEGEGHEFYGVLNGTFLPAPNAYWDTIMNQAIDFFYEVHKPSASYTTSTQNNTVNFTNTSMGAINYHWDFGDGTISTDVNPQHQFTSLGTYTIQLTAQSQNLSWDTLSTTIQVDEIAGIVLNPKPTGNIWLSNQMLNLENIEGPLEIYNICGQKVMCKNLMEKPLQSIDLHPLVKGIYLINTPTLSKKIILN